MPFLQKMTPLSSKCAVHRGGVGTLALVLSWLLAACGNAASGGAAAASSKHADSGSDNGAASAATGSHDSGMATGVGGANGRSTAAPEQTASSDDGGPQTNDGGSAPQGVQTDSGSGLRDIGSCCMQQSTPGCSNPDLEVCVCAKDQSCCATAWDAPCVLIVQQKYCQPGIRDCVCGTDAGQWGQTECCGTDWTSSCDSVATLKCNAVQGCF
jgi:hypothetical protein